MKKLLMLVPAAALLGLAAPLPADPPAPAASEGPAPAGALLFKQHCGTCHATQAGKTSGFGPNLAGVFGRQAAAGEFRYSPALKASGLTWTREKLDAYLAAPMKLVPGTRMIVGLPDPAQRAAVLDYLASLSAPAAPPPAGEHDAHAGH